MSLGATSDWTNEGLKHRPNGWRDSQQAVWSSVPSALGAPSEQLRAITLWTCLAKCSFKGGLFFVVFVNTLIFDTTTKPRYY